MLETTRDEIDYVSLSPTRGLQLPHPLSLITHYTFNITKLLVRGAGSFASLPPEHPRPTSSSFPSLSFEPPAMKFKPLSRPGSQSFTSRLHNSDRYGTRGQLDMVTPVITAHGLPDVVGAAEGGIYGDKVVPLGGGRVLVGALDAVARLL